MSTESNGFKLQLNTKLEDVLLYLQWEGGVGGEACFFFSPPNVFMLKNKSFFMM